MPATLASASGVFKACARPAIRLARAAPAYCGLALQPRHGPLVAFLPAYGPTGAALLRIYNIADALRGRGWRTLVVPWRLTLAQRQRLLQAAAPDLLVMQGVRHALNRPALYQGRPILMDMDDADFHLPHLSGPVRRAMPLVDGVIAGSAYVADWARAAGAGAAHVVWTGTPLSARRPAPQVTRPPVVAWAQTRPMTYVREAEMVREVTARLAARHPGLTLRLYDRMPGDDPAFANSFQAPGLTVEWRKTSRYSDYMASFDDAALGLAPLSGDNPFARGKSFGKVLAYLDARVPVIASDACEHGAFFAPDTGVVSNDLETWVNAGARLLQDAPARDAMADRAFAEFQKHLTIDAAADRVDGILRRYLSA